jgi:hypothetical protein
VLAKLRPLVAVGADPLADRSVDLCRERRKADHVGDVLRPRLDPVRRQELRDRRAVAREAELQPAAERLNEAVDRLLCASSQTRFTSANRSPSVWKSFPARRRPMIAQSISIGFRSGEFGGQPGRTFMCRPIASIVGIDVCIEAPSRMKNQLFTPYCVFAWLRLVHLRQHLPTDVDPLLNLNSRQSLDMERWPPFESEFVTHSTDRCAIVMRVEL